MPLYDFKCKSCDFGFEQVAKIIDEYVYCPECDGLAFRQISKPNIHVFKAQVLENLQHENAPYVRNRQELTDAINRYNDGELASKQGKAAVL
jgi:putative FmdB family regulatory protein